MKNAQKNILTLAVAGIVAGMASVAAAEQIAVFDGYPDFEVEIGAAEVTYEQVFSNYTAYFQVDGEIYLTPVGSLRNTYMSIDTEEGTSWYNGADEIFYLLVGADDLESGPLEGYQLPSPFLEVTDDEDFVKVESEANIFNHYEGIKANIAYTFFKDRPLVRAVYTLSNTTEEDLSQSVWIGGDYYSDTDVTLEKTSTGGIDSGTGSLTVSDDDLWYVTGDDDRGEAILTLSTHGVDAPVVPVNIVKAMDGNDRFALQYPVVIPAGESITIIAFSEMTPTLGGYDNGIGYAAQAAADFESLEALEAAGLLAGISEESVASLVNYAPFAEVVDETTEEVTEDVSDDVIETGTESGDEVSSGGSSSGGALSFPLLLIGGLLAFRRKRA